MLLTQKSGIDPKIKALVYGAGGTGKTWLGATSPDPVILLLEQHGYESIVQSARLRGVEPPPVFWIRSVAALAEAIKILGTNTSDPIAALVRSSNVVPDLTQEERNAAIAALPYVVPGTVVLDSLSEASDLIEADLDASLGERLDKDGLPFRPVSAWGVVMDRVLGLVRKMRDLPYHVLMLALVSEREIGEGLDKVVTVGPLVATAKLSHQIVPLVNLAGIMRSTMRPAEGGGVEIVRAVQFIAPSSVVTKTMHGLAEYEAPSFGAWIARVRGEVDSTPLARTHVPTVNPDSGDDASAVASAPKRSAAATGAGASMGRKGGGRR